MSKNFSKPNVAQLLKELSQQGLIDESNLVDFIQRELSFTQLPLYSKILMGVGVFIVALCIVGFMAAGGIFYMRDSASCVIIGLSYIALALGLQTIVKYDEQSAKFFFKPLSLGLMILGKVLLLNGIVQGIGCNSCLVMDWNITWGLLIITCLTYPFYWIPLERFFSVFFLLLSLGMNIVHNMDNNPIYRELSINGLFFMQFIGGGTLIIHRKFKHTYLPMAYACAFSLVLGMLLLDLPNLFDYDKFQTYLQPLFVNSVLAGGLIVLYILIAGGIEKIKYEPLILVTISAILLVLFSASTILLALNFMVLGYAKQQRLLLLMGILLLPIFLCYYYYNLSVFLLTKSGILLGSGLVLLLGRFYMQYRGLDRAGATCPEK